MQTYYFFFFKSVMSVIIKKMSSSSVAIPTHEFWFISTNTKEHTNLHFRDESSAFHFLHHYFLETYGLKKKYIYIYNGLNN